MVTWGYHGLQEQSTHPQRAPLFFLKRKGAQRLLVTSSAVKKSASNHEAIYAMISMCSLVIIQYPQKSWCLAAGPFDAPLEPSTSCLLREAVSLSQSRWF